MEVTLHPAPRWRDVVLEQVRVVGLSLRREALVVAVVLGIVTLMIGIGTSIFTGVWCTRLFFDFQSNRRGFDRVSV